MTDKDVAHMRLMGQGNSVPRSEKICPHCESWDGDYCIEGEDTGSGVFCDFFLRRRD